MACVHTATLGGTLWFDGVQVNGFVGITGVGPGGAKKIATHCADSNVETFIKGRAQAGTASVEINFDPTDATHITMTDAALAGTTHAWIYKYAEGTKQLSFSAYIDAWPQDMPDDDIVKINATLQLDGNPVIGAAV